MIQWTMKVLVLTKMVMPCLPGGHIHQQTGFNILTIQLLKTDAKGSITVSKAKNFLKLCTLILQICLLLREIIGQVNVCPRPYHEMILTPKFGEFIHTPWGNTGLCLTYILTRRHIEVRDQVISTLEFFQAIDIYLKHILSVTQGEQALVLFQSIHTLDVEKLKGKCQSQHITLVFALVLKEF